jgi:hypothetical protein
MATEVTALALNVKSDSVAKGASRLDKLTTSATRSEKSSKSLTKATARNAVAMAKNATTTGASSTATKAQAAANVGATTTTKGLTVATAGLGATLKSTLGPLLALLGPVLLLKKAFSSTVELQDFQAQLKTATGTVQNAAVAFEALEDFASETPFQLEQSLEAFIKLTNLGLTPSEKALRSYGNTASAMGKDMVQLIEAVADATTGEFERLKEFGIKAKSEGDKVSLTFRGVTTTIGKNAAEIEGYLIALGENEFAGAMGDRMDTLGGQVSNLGDLWNKLFRTVSEMGVGNVMSATVQVGIDALTELIAIMESGQFETELEAWGVAFEDWAKDFETTLGMVGDLFGTASQDWVDTSGNGFKGIIDLFKLLPAQIRAWVRRIGVEISALAMYGEAAGKAIVIAMVEYFKGLVSTARNYASMIGKALNPFDDTDFKQAMADGWKQQEKIALATADKITKAYKDAEKEIGAARQARLEMIEEIDTDFNKTVAQVDTLAQKSRELRATYDAEREARKKARATGTAPDRLEQFKIKPEGAATEDKGDSAAVKKAKEEAEKLAKIEERKQKRLIDAERKAQEQREMFAQRRVSTTANLLSALSSLDRSQSEETQRRNKALAIAAATVNTYQGASQALKEPGASTYLKLANAAAIVATGLIQVQNIREAGNYATGGIVPGSSFTGDNVGANVNSGEMILNRSQQARLFALANNTGDTTTSNAGAVALNVTVENYGSSEISVERMSETDIRIIARDVVREEAPATIASDLQNPNSRTSNALARNTNAQRRRN